ncbi:MAG: cytochrome c oxidase subunit II [Thermodesulfobacteriota bacterium]
MVRRFYKFFTLLLLAFPSAALAYEEGGAGGIQDPKEGFKHLWNETMWDITVIGIIFALITLYMLVKYRRKHPDQEGRPVKLNATQVIGWALVPIFVFMADDFFLGARGWNLWNEYRQVPENSYEIKLESMMWTWHFTYPNGVETYNELRVPAGKPILMRMTSADVIHSMFIPDFRVKEDSMPGRITYLWFYPKETGEHVITCAEYCGMMHSSMHGKLIVMPEEEFNAWLKKEKGGAES